MVYILTYFYGQNWPIDSGKVGQKNFLTKKKLALWGHLRCTVGLRPTIAGFARYGTPSVSKREKKLLSYFEVFFFFKILTLDNLCKIMENLEK
jgi:hypothetical protein